ncbi:MAG TPA: chloride channel protein [Chthoniobacterales bacterium]
MSGATTAKPDEVRALLGDFRTDSRMLVLIALAVPIGVVAALVAKVLLWLIAELTNLVFFQRFSPLLPPLTAHHLGAWVIAAPVVGALVIGLMARFGSEKIRGHGIPEALEAILLGGSLVEPKVALLKPISSAISIGTGGPFGAEGPIIMTGGAFGSIIAQLFHLTAAERKTLLVAGAAGGMAAVFSAPIAATLLAIELLLFEWRPRSFIPVAVASVVAALLRVPLLGAGPIFPIASHAGLGPSAIFWAIGIGILAGFGSGLLTGLVYFCEDIFLKLPIHWMWWPAIGAVFVGLGGWLDPRVLGVGYYLINDLLHGQILGVAVLTLLVLKAVVWSISLGSGTSGGVLAPLLIIGGALGSYVGQWLPAGDAGLWAMVAMAGMMGGTMRSPLTGMFFMLELTGDFGALPALLCGSVAALAVTVLLMRRSILTEKLARRGQHIAREYSVDLFELMRVADVMDRDFTVLPASTPLRRYSARVASGDPLICSHQGTLLANEAGELVGIITRGDVVRSFERSNDETLTVLEAGQSNLIVTYSDETLYDAIARMLRHNVGRLPVVDRDAPQTAIGYLGRAGILAARQRYHREEDIRESGASIREAARRLKA